MTSPEKISQTWMVAGIKHEIFMRVFPALRHGLVGPVSIARMSVSIVRRLLSKGDGSKSKLNEQIERVDQQLTEAVQGIRALQAWEPGAKGIAVPDEILRQGLALMTARLALRDIKLDYVPSDIQDADEVQHQPLLYAWLGMLCYFEDELQVPAILRIEQKQAKAVTIEVTHPLYDASQVNARPEAHTCIIDKVALQAVVHAGGFRLELDGEVAHLSWAINHTSP